MSCGEGAAAGSRAPVVRVCLHPDLPDAICRVAEGVELVSGRSYLVSTPDGERLGILRPYRLPVLREPSGGLAGTVVREASAAEAARAAELGRLAVEALRLCREWARREQAELRPVSAFAPLDRNQLVITFSAEQRVDFRSLLRDLGRRTRRRVELRQVGVRDQAKASGGWGPCGRPLCCSTFMARFTSVSIRMAKAQNLALNPSRISGMCGRLMCCLNHELAEVPGRRKGERC